MDKDTQRLLVRKALEMRGRAYCPYSHFAVGAALLGKDGTIYTGCNIENGTLTPTVCAERTAFFKAISEGQREFEGIAICGGHEDREPDRICAPCGVCRQVMMEFCHKDFEIILGISEENMVVETLETMLPYGFRLDEQM
ncbi:MAG: cytidine deaminase [Lachnospiraceae bacterium]|nr:cytidine deaminase [Lachnospiraceae bacterium]